MADPWVDLAALHNPTDGYRPPVEWGLGILSNLDLLAGAACVEDRGTWISASASYVSSVGPQVTVDTLARVLYVISAEVTSTTDTVLSVSVTGATTVAASDDQCAYALGNFGSLTALGLLSGLTPGENVFHFAARVSAGGTTTMKRRRLLVVPLTT